MNYLIELSDIVATSLKANFTRYLFNDIPLDQRLVIIKGARGTGKTTMLLQLMQSLNAPNGEKIYISLDNIFFLENTLMEVADKFYKQGGKFLFLDEVHRYPNWIVELKNIYDHYPTLHIICTGSSALSLHRGEADLSRRALVFSLNELSLREFLALSQDIIMNPITLEDILSRHPEISKEINKKIRPIKVFGDYIKSGAYPLFTEGDLWYHERLRATINTVLETDMPAMENISYHSVVQIKKLLFILAQSVPFTPNISELSRKMAISRDVLLRYLYMLEKAELIFQLRKDTRGISYLSKPDKLFLHNTNLVIALSARHHEKGTLRETFLLNQIAVKSVVTSPKQGDFLVDDQFTIEVGGKNKPLKQLSGIPNSFIAADDIETGSWNKIPLWLFGFLY